MGWVMKRLAEPSTRIGLGILLATVLGVLDNPPADGAGWLTVASTLAASLAGIVTKAPGSPDAVPAK